MLWLTRHHTGKTCLSVCSWSIRTVGAYQGVVWACMLLGSTFGRTIGPLRFALPGARSAYPPDDRYSACAYSITRIAAWRAPTRSLAENRAMHGRAPVLTPSFLADGGTMGVLMRTTD